MSLSLLLEIAASLDPDRPAVGSRETAIAVAELKDLAYRGASVLNALNAGSAVFVGANGPAFPVTVFAAAAAGIPAVPLNYRSTTDQFVGLVSRVEKPVVIADEEFVPALVAGLAARADTAPISVLSTSAFLDKARTAERADPGQPDPDAPAVLLFTSGTTSEPKCVVLRNSQLTSYVLGTVEPGSSSRSEAALISVPSYHVAGIGTVLTNLVSGRRMVYLPQFSPGAWLELVRVEEVTFAMVVPTMLARIVDEIGEGTANVPQLRGMAYGGGRMPRPVLERALLQFPETGFVNAYGLTETSSTIALLGPEDHRRALSSEDPVVRERLGSVGRFIPGIEGEIRDPGGRVLPAGVQGELWVRGPQVSGEYQGVGSVLDANGWFATRDNARLDEDGYLFIDGRRDDVIIRGGENIAPQEIEDVLLKHPAISEAAVVGLADQEWGDRLAAVLVVHPGAHVEAEEVRDFVRSHLRSAKTPDAVYFTRELPHTATGKLLRRELVARYGSGGQ